MSKRCKLQKEYYQAKGSYKGNGKYNDKYVRWLEDQVLALRMHDIGNPRELLAAFQRDYNKRNFEDSQIIDRDIELFLAANCD